SQWRKMIKYTEDSATSWRNALGRRRSPPTRETPVPLVEESPSPHDLRTSCAPRASAVMAAEAGCSPSWHRA
ncbi:hypothetical protein PENTCL1PPCAC_19315, partial [Pristionchus entomophagus]